MMMGRTSVQAIVWVLLGTALFSLIYSAGKFLGPGVPVLQLIFLRYAGGLLSVLGYMLWRGERWRNVSSRNAPAHFMRALFGVSGGAAFIYAAANMPVMDASAIGLLNVPIAIALGVIVLGETLRRGHLIGFGLCLAGALAIIASRGAFASISANSMIPAAIALAGALFIGIEGLLLRMLSTNDRTISVLLHVNFFGLALMSVPAFLVWQPVDWLQTGACLSFGLIAVIAQLANVRGYRLAPISVVAPVDYSWLIFSALIGLIFFAEAPGAATLAGALAIFGGGMVLAAAERDSITPGNDSDVKAATASPQQAGQG